MTESVKRILVIGAGSEIALACLRHRLERIPIEIVLLGRNEHALEALRQDLLARGAPRVEVLAGENGNPDAVATLNDALPAGPIDEAWLSLGVLGEPDKLRIHAGAMRELTEVNFTATALWMERIADHMVAQGTGHLIVFGSVAGDRGRASNYAYGATKAALERYAEGLAHRLASETRIHISILKPGPTRTAMTAHMDRSSMLWADVQDVVACAEKGIRNRRAVIYAPGRWAWIMRLIRSLPRALFHRLTI